MPTLINERTITTYDRAMGGTWKNPTTGVPSIQADVSEVEDIDGIPTERKQIGQVDIVFNPTDPRHITMFGIFRELVLEALAARAAGSQAGE